MRGASVLDLLDKDAPTIREDGRIALLCARRRLAGMCDYDGVNGDRVRVDS